MTPGPRHVPPLKAACGGRGVQKAFSIENRRFGRYLRSVRESRRLSLDAVEEMSTGYPERITKSHLSRIENGQAVPTFPRMFALSEIYGVPVSSMAERFEIDLKHGMLSASIEGKSREEAEEEAESHRYSGHYREAIGLFDYLIERCVENSEPSRVVGWRLRRAYCLMGLERYNAAKDELELLFNHHELRPLQRLEAFHCFVGCCKRTGRFTIALMAMEQAQREAQGIQDLPPLKKGALDAGYGEVLNALGRGEEAVSAYQSAIDCFEANNQPFEASQTRLNLSNALIELDRNDEARRLLDSSLRSLEGKGFDRLLAFALSNRGKIAFRTGELDAAESFCIRSNSIARPREYTSIIFCNCFYLWRIGEARDDRATINTNEKTLKTLLRRVTNFEEVEIFRAHLTGVKA